MTAAIIRSDFEAQENKVCHCFHCFPIYLWWSDGTGCHDLSCLNAEFLSQLFHSPLSSLSRGSLVPLCFLPLGWYYLKVKMLVTRPCLTLCDPIDYSPPHFSVHGTIQERMLSGLPCPYPGDLPDPVIEPGSPTLHAGSLPVWATREAHQSLLIFLPAILIPGCASSILAFHMIYSAYKLNKQSNNIQPWHTPFPILNRSVVLWLVVAVASWPA